MPTHQVAVHYIAANHLDVERVAGTLHQMRSICRSVRQLFGGKLVACAAHRKRTAPHCRSCRSSYCSAEQRALAIRPTFRRWQPTRRTGHRSVHRCPAAAVISKGTSASIRASASITFPASATTPPLASCPLTASGGSARKPRPVRLAGVAPAGNGGGAGIGFLTRSIANLRR